VFVRRHIQQEIDTPSARYLIEMQEVGIGAGSVSGFPKPAVANQVVNLARQVITYLPGFAILGA
jgi:hypothetical protein